MRAPTLRLERRVLLKAALAALGSGAPLEALAGGRPPGMGRSPGYGPLAPALDESTGLPLLSLPRGFRYLSMGWTGDPMQDGGPTPPAHDGGGALRGPRGRVHYVRNHEISASFAARSFAPDALTYDANDAGGGTTTVEFDPQRGRFLRTTPSLGGTVRNCSGGPTPWNSWLSCEETLDGPERPGAQLEETHGWVFEVPARRPARPEPLRGLGRFVHEAAAVDPFTGIVYQTEDASASGIYRFLPARYGRLRAAGRLEMLALSGLPGFDTGVGLGRGSSFIVEWVPIADPEDHPFAQGLASGGAIFRRGEGMAYGRGAIFFTTTSGGAAREGQVWALDPWRDRLTLLFESPGRAVLDNPDNLTVSPRGGIVVCEDGGRPNFLRGLTRSGEIFDFARNDIVLAAPHNASVPAGDYRGSEFAGASFSWNGRWLFVNVQRPGVSFAITGPWRPGAL